MKILDCLFVGIILLSSQSCISQDSDVIDKNIKMFMEAVRKKDINEIMSYVPNTGLTDGDTIIQKEEIKNSLTNEESVLYKYLFSYNKDEKIICLRNEAVVSPGYFFKKVGKDYKYSVGKFDEPFNDMYGVKVISSEQFGGCKLILWFIDFKVYESRIMLDSYFFK